MVPVGLLVDLHSCEQHTPVVGRRPRFSWMFAPDVPWHAGKPAPDTANARSAGGIFQTAYRIQVTGTSGHVVHDTGKLVSPDSVAVPMTGWQPEPGKPYGWQVMAWDSQGKPGPWSARGGFAVESAPLPKVVSAPDRLVVRKQTPVATANAGVGLDFLDFGRAFFGNVVVSGAAGQRVVVRMGEKRNGNRVETKPGRNVRFHEEIVVIGADGTGVPRLRPQDRRRMPDTIGPVMPFRYAELEQAPGGGATLSRTICTVPFDADSAWFTSSDPVLDAVWTLCKDTMEATSFCGVYVDGDRERLPYEADAYINMLGHYAVDRSYATARHSHELLLFEPTWPTEWILFSVLMAWQDYLHTGDPVSLARHAKILDAKSLRRIARPDGLISTVDPPVPRKVLDAIFRADPIRDNVDWPQGERDGYAMVPVNTVVNAFFLAALADLAGIADVVGDPALASAVRAHRARAGDAFQKVFYNESIGLYVDGEGTTHASIHANLFPLAFGLVPDSRRKRVAEYVASRGMACSVYAAQFLVDGLYAAGRGDAGMGLLHSRAERSWAHMVFDVGSTIALEAWDDRFKPNQDWNHAWGAAPANLIPRHVVGVSLVEPGAAFLRISPDPGHLAHFDAQVPTVRGGVRVRFERQGNHERYDIRLPVHCRGEFVLRTRRSGAPAELRVDGTGHPVDALATGIRLLPGVVHRIEVRGGG